MQSSFPLSVDGLGLSIENSSQAPGPEGAVGFVLEVVRLHVRVISLLTDARVLLHRLLERLSLSCVCAFVKNQLGLFVGLFLGSLLLSIDLRVCPSASPALPG